MFSLELREVVSRYLAGDLALEQLEDWIVPRLQASLESPHAPDAAVVSAIELGLAELSAGIRSEAEFRQLLRDVLQDYPVFLNLTCAPAKQVITSSSNRASYHLMSMPDAGDVITTIEQRSYVNI